MGRRRSSSGRRGRRERRQRFPGSCGYTVVALNGGSAPRVSRSYSGPIHLLITDVVMPKMGGPQVAAHLLEERPSMKTLFVSGYAENTILQHGNIDVAARFLLSKPFSLSAWKQDS